MCTHVGNMYTCSEKSRVSAHISVFVTHLRPLPDGEKPVSTVHSILYSISIWVLAKFISHLSEDRGYCSRMVLKDEASVFGYSVSGWSA